MHRALSLVCAVALNAAWIGHAQAAQVCAWIVESIEDGDTHKFDLNLSTDAATQVSVRFQGPGFTSASMGGELIQLDPGEAKSVDGEGFDVDPGDDISFDLKLFNHPISFEEMDNPTRTPLAAFTFHRKVGEGEKAPPADLAVKQCKPLG